MKKAILYKKLVTLTLMASLATTNLGGVTVAKSLEQINASQAVETALRFSPTEEASEIKMPNAPITPAYMPSELLEANIKEDALYNKSNVPLKDRVADSELMPVNSTQGTETKVAALSIMNANTSGNVPHGTNTFASNTFSYYQYIDKLVYWGGSAGEGIIVPPTPDVVDAAHTNGVPVLGTVFFPPEVYGGKQVWLDEFLQKDASGTFIIIDKLIELADEFGFDGWFINQETEVLKKGEEPTEQSKEYATLFQEFIAQFKEEAGDSLEVMWYDSITEEGVMDWQNQLNTKNDAYIMNEQGQQLADSMFLNFWWTTDRLASQGLLESSAKHADEIGLDEKDLFAGIDMQANGTATPIKWDLLENERGTHTSIGLYCPSWTYFSSGGDEVAFQEKENDLYVNEFGNPSKDSQATGTEWRGLSKFVTENTVINQAPFETNYSFGNGRSFFIDGALVSRGDWNNRSLTDVLPTYRWMIEENGNTVDAEIDYERAYYGGNSIKLEGELKSNTKSQITLFSADLLIEEGFTVTTAARGTNGVTLNLLFEYADGTMQTFSPSTTLTSGWNELTYDISTAEGKTVQKIGYEFYSPVEHSEMELNLGGLSIQDQASQLDVIDVEHVQIDDVMFEEDDTLAGIHLSWEASDEGLEAYEVYRKNPDGTVSLLGATLNNRFFINSLQRNIEVMETELLVVARNKDGAIGQGASTTFTWTDNTVPKTKFVVSDTLVAPNQEITLINKSNSMAEEFEWTFEGANITTSTEENPVISYAEEGEYTIKLVAKNAQSEAEYILEDVVKVTKDAVGGLTNFARNAETSASSYVNDNEKDTFAVDGDVTKKWCAVGPDQHNITINLGEVKTISRVDIHHAEAGGEGASMNTEEYMIEVSTDGENFTTVAEVDKNRAGVTKDSFTPQEAQYVRFTVLKATQGGDTAARIYEVEVYGLE